MNMDNLFAVIIPFNNGIKDSPSTNGILSSVVSKNSYYKSTEIYNYNNYIGLVQYSNKNRLSPDLPKPHKTLLKEPIIGNSRIDNKHLLSSLHEINIQDKSICSSIDDQLLLSCYEKIGADVFSAVKGNFQTIFWDKKSQTLCAGIDAFSSRSLFFSKQGNALYISSDAKTLANVTNIKLTLNKLALSQWLSGRPNPDLSMYNEISRLPAGYCLQFGTDYNVVISKVWDIDPNISVEYNNTDDYKEHFFELLQSSVTNRIALSPLSEKPSIFCQMSGGMDSTSVTAIAKSLLDQKNLPLHTLSHRYKHTKTCDESNNINAMISTLGLTHQHYIELDEYSSCSFSALYPTDFDNPGVVLSPKYYQELALMKSLGANVLLTGNGGDETCWGHSASYRSRLYKGDFNVVPEVIKACSQLDEPILRSLYTLFMPSSIQNLVKLARNKPINSNDCPPWLSPLALGLVTETNKMMANPFSKTFNPAKYARYYGIKNTSTYNAMRSYQKIASDFNIDVRHPFFDTDIVQFSFSIPDKLLINCEYPKWLLRHTMQDHLPHSVCWNKHKVVFDHHFANLVRHNKVELRKLLSHGGLQDLGLLDNNTLLKEFDAVVNNPNGHLNVDMLYAILTQLWFQTHYVS
jgi:asparagine synthetase B (glutamine-hydrolysing)